MLICGLVVMPKNTFAAASLADMFVTPNGDVNFFGGYLGGDGDWNDPNGALDWAIGNRRVFSPLNTEDLVISTMLPTAPNIADGWRHPDNWFERMRITKDGNVGIGTDAPSDKLDIVGGGIRLGGDVVPMFISPGVDVTALNPGATTSAGQITNPLNRHLVIDIRANDTHDSFAIRTDTNQNGTVDNIAMVVRPNGRVGIGTISPAYPLHVSHPSHNIAAIFDSGDPFSLITFRDNLTTTESSVGIGAEGDDLRLRAGNTNRLRIESTGQVTTPAVTGSAHLPPIAYGRISSDGTVLSGTGNFTVTRENVGDYNIRWNGLYLSPDTIIVHLKHIWDSGDGDDVRPNHFIMHPEADGLSVHVKCRYHFNCTEKWCGYGPIWADWDRNFSFVAYNPILPN